MKNPEAAIEKFLGKTLNIGKRIQVVDQSNPEVAYINIPAKPNLDDVELNEKQLEMVAGGTEPHTWVFKNITKPVVLWILGED